MPNFSCTHHTEDGTAVVTLAGEIDLAASDALWNKLSGQLENSTIVVTDCHDVTFLDSAGLQSLLRAFYRSMSTNTQFALIRPSKAVTRVLKLSGLTGVLPVFDDAAEARKRWRN
ncbi:anti-anti-sigma factor [Catenulispora sp. GP43]|uniref:STAS domain-containing protein n=1 Tax=Catenulispora sp. GP43 TaxID=3156263 RepID=UPI00351234CB